MSRVFIRKNDIPEARAKISELLQEFSKERGLAARCSVIRGYEVSASTLYGPVYINSPGAFYIFDGSNIEHKNPILKIDIFDRFTPVEEEPSTDDITVEGILLKLEDEQRLDIAREIFRRITEIGGIFAESDILSALARKSAPLSDREYQELAARSLIAGSNLQKDFLAVPEIFYDSSYVTMAEKHGLRTLEVALETIDERLQTASDKHSRINYLKERMKQNGRFDESSLYFFDANGILAAEATIRKGGAHTYGNRDYSFKEIKLIARDCPDAFVRDFLGEGNGYLREKKRHDGHVISTHFGYGKLIYTGIKDIEGKNVPITCRNLVF